MICSSLTVSRTTFSSSAISCQSRSSGSELQTLQDRTKTCKSGQAVATSSEALRRRILRELPLYKVDTLVDLINLVSIRSGYSIGGFDADKIAGGSLVLGVGREGEVYHGIGRGELNIAGLPVYRDAVGGVGTPTSDEERTKIGLDTTRLLMIINGYSGLEGLEAAGKYAVGLLSKYVSAINMEVELITVEDRRKITL